MRSCTKTRKSTYPSQSSTTPGKYHPPYVTLYNILLKVQYFSPFKSIKFEEEKICILLVSTFLCDRVHDCHLILSQHSKPLRFFLSQWTFAVFSVTESTIAWWRRTFAWTDTSRWPPSMSSLYHQDDGDVCNNHDHDLLMTRNASRLDHKVRQCCQMQLWGHHFLFSCRCSFLFVAHASLDFLRMLFHICVTWHLPLLSLFWQKQL